MRFTITNLINFFQSDKRAIEKGENHVKSNHVVLFRYDDGHLTGKVKSSMKKINYEVQVLIFNQELPILNIINYLITILFLQWKIYSYIFIK